MPSDTSSAIGEYLLKGWAMMGDSCPECCVPLLRSPDRVRMICVGCHSEWPSDETPNLSNGVTQQSQKLVGQKSYDEQPERSRQLSSVQEGPSRTSPTVEEEEEEPRQWKQTVACSLERKMEYLAKRLDDAVDMDTIDRIMATMEKCSNVIERYSKH
uniref:Uncharacterized protein n=1 Tax=Perkinsus chesapeaki TaxID=330153 RepID=A7YXN2_PERCH|nr:conserved hypothetical protein [Perkinsus chesapeaki]